jgi:cytochrome c553
MLRLASKSLAIMAGVVLLAAGCDDEVTTSPDGGANKDGGSDGSAATGDGAASDTAAPGPDAAPLTAVQARGQYLVDHVIACGDCHTPRGAMGAPVPGKYLSGAECFVKLPNGDCLHTRNLTNDPTGLKNRTDDEIKNMFLNGMRPPATSGGTETATALNPVMPYYVFHNMDAADADAIVAYLRTVPAVDHAVPARGKTFDVPAPAAPLNPDLIPLPMANYPNKESAMHGRYLTSKIGLCVECHTQHTMPGSGPDVLMSSKLFQGGEQFDLGFPVVPVSKNLTSDPTTGLGNWTLEQVIAAFKEGKDKDGKGICPPMPYGPMGAYGGLNYQDTLDIAHYIKSLPPAVNMIVDMCTFPFGPPPAMGDGGAPAGDGGATSDGAPAIDGPVASPDGAMTSDATASD